MGGYFCRKAQRVELRDAANFAEEFTELNSPNRFDRLEIAANVGQYPALFLVARRGARGRRRRRRCRVGDGGSLIGHSHGCCCVAALGHAITILRSYT